MSGKKVFIVGPGFIGWNIIDLLHPKGYTISGLVRRKEHAEGIRASGATPIMGDLNDKSLIIQHTLSSDIVFHTATADHLPSAAAVLEGIKQRAASGKSTVYIHTSGTSVLDDSAHGRFKSDKVFHDDKPGEIDALEDSAPHREIDLAILKAKRELGDKAKIAIMVPPLIYGFNPAHGRLTIQIPTMTRWALKHGYAPFVGEGKSVESNIHVKDLARGYVTLLEALEKADATDAIFDNPYWFCETTGDQEPSWKEVASVIGEGLYRAGKIDNKEPKSVPEKLYGDLFGEYTSAVVGLNSRSRAVRLRELGWKPVEKDWRKSYLEDELPEILKEENVEFNGYAGTVAS